MENANAMANLGSLIADPTRAEMLIAMMDGRAHPASDLAAIAHVSPPTASHHLARLIEGGLVEVFQQGRHRYHRLAGSQVAELLESIGSLTAPQRSRPMRPGQAKIAYCRSCYDHLAGELGVGLRKRLEDMGVVLLEGDRYQVTPSGRGFFSDFGVHVDDLGQHRRPLAKACLDWTERLPHIGGSLGAAIFSRLLERGWVDRVEGCRAIVVTTFGEECLGDTFGLSR